MKRLLILLLLLAPCLRSDNAPSAADTAATVIAMSGDAEYEADGGGMQPLILGQLLTAGDRLVTKEGANLELALADGSTLALGPNSEMEVSSVGQGDAQSKSFFELLKGSIDAIVHKLTLGAAFEVRTANAVAAVKGTQFEVTAGDSSSAVTVQEGTVAMSDPQRHTTVFIPPLRRALSSDNGPLPPQRLSEAEAIAFRLRWAQARSVHANRSALLKGFEASSAQRRAALLQRLPGLAQRLRDKAEREEKKDDPKTPGRHQHRVKKLAKMEEAKK